MKETKIEMKTVGENNAVTRMGGNKEAVVELLISGTIALIHDWWNKDTCPDFKTCLQSYCDVLMTVGADSAEKIENSCRTPQGKYKM